MKTYNPEIFISYAWGDEDSETGMQRKQFNDYIINLLKEKEFNLICDRNELSYKDNIRDFMNRIGEGHFIVVILSEKYLKSKYCMYELLTIINNGNYRERFYPIVMNDAKIDDPIDRLQYYQHWESQIENLNSSLKSISDHSYIGAIQQELFEYSEYKRIIIDFASITSNTLVTRINPSKAYNINDFLKSLEAGVMAYQQNIIKEETSKITSDFNKVLQTATDQEKLRQQEFFTRIHLKNMNLNLKIIKIILYELNYMEEYSESDDFDIVIADAVARFQSAEGLKPVDGIYGPDTHKALVEASKRAGLLPN